MLRLVRALSAFGGILFLLCTYGMLAAVVAKGCEEQTKKNASAETIKFDKRQQQGAGKDLRAIWIATVNNIDWPSSTSKQIADPQERITVQQAELCRLFDQVVELGMNAVIFQVKPCADALYRSTLLPWSSCLTGTFGEDPGFDPLAYALEQAHRRGLQLHAWMNPYRVSTSVDVETVEALSAVSNSIYHHHPDCIKIANHRYLLDPGLPQVRSWILQVVEELITHYSIDGLHFDDYFYDESSNSMLADDRTYQYYGQEFHNKADWRRNNTYLLIQAVSQKIKKIRPDILFGISPSGVWRNKSDDPDGSNTMMLSPHYDTAYADTRRWVKEELVDYIAPQVYWSHELSIAPYDLIVNWWANVVKGTKTKLYIGIALYKVGQEFSYKVAGNQIVDRQWAMANGVPEIKRQLMVNETTTGVDGSILFSASYLWKPQTQWVIDYLKDHWGKIRVTSSDERVS